MGLVNHDEASAKRDPPLSLLTTMEKYILVAKPALANGKELWLTVDDS